MEEENRDDLLSSLFPAIAAEMRGMLSTLYLAATSLAPADRREQDSDLDKRAARLDQSYYQLLRLVSDLSAAAQLSDPKPLIMQDCDLILLVQDLCDGVEALAELMGLKLEFRCREPRLVCAVHPDSIRQLLYQLLSNALKFTPAGGAVAVELKREGKFVYLSVSDNGVGIDELQLNALFHRYLKKARPEPPPHGLGLGLALCQRVARDHGGALLADSQPGKGSRFILRLPDRKSGRPELSDVAFDYTGGFSSVLLGLADALPIEAFTIKNR